MRTTVRMVYPTARIGEIPSRVRRPRISENLAEFSFIVIGFCETIPTSDYFLPTARRLLRQSCGNVADLRALPEIRRGDRYANEIERKEIWEKGLTES
jgi:hypothetical protein